MNDKRNTLETEAADVVDDSPSSGASPPGAPNSAEQLRSISPHVLRDMSQTLSEMEDRLEELVRLTTAAGNFWPWAKRTIMLSIPALLAFSLLYGQYVASSNESRHAAAETQFRLAIEQLESSAFLVRADGVRTLYDIAFSEHLVGSSGGFFAPFVNIGNWFVGKAERPFLKPARSHFAAYITRPRDDLATESISSVLLEVGLTWVQRESSPESTDVSQFANERSLLVGAQLPRAKLPAIAFGSIDLSGANLRHSDLSYSDFTNATLDRVVFDDAQLISATLTQASLSGSQFRSANLSFTNMHDVSASGSTTDFSGANFSQAELTLSTFQNAVFVDAVFRNAALVDTDFTAANLTRAKFTQANLAGASFQNADLTDADLRFASGLDKVTTWRGATLEGAQLPEEWKEIIHANSQQE